MANKKYITTQPVISLNHNNISFYLAFITFDIANILYSSSTQGCDIMNYFDYHIYF